MKRVQGQLRTLKLALEKRIKKRMNSEHMAFAWLIEWAATILHRFAKGASGQTPYRIITGMETRRPIAEFGERVLYAHEVAERNRLEGQDRGEIPPGYMAWAEAAV